MFERDTQQIPYALVLALLLSVLLHLVLVVHLLPRLQFEANPLDTLSNDQWFQVDCD